MRKEGGRGSRREGRRETEEKIERQKGHALADGTTITNNQVCNIHCTFLHMQTNEDNRLSQACSHKYVRCLQSLARRALVRQSLLPPRGPSSQGRSRGL